MFNFDNERNILNLIPIYINNILLLHGNSFERKIQRYLQNVDSFTENNGHDCPPPDFYSDKFSCMFDILRINDSEVKKSFNPIIAEEQKIRKVYERETFEDETGEKKGLLDSPYLQMAFVADTTGDINEHSFEKYKKQAKRVIKVHIDKIPIWENEHPDIQHKGLLIFDETGLCIKAVKNHVIDDYFSYTFEAKNKLQIHETWNDREFIEPIYKSNLDFVIWFNPLKAQNDILFKYNEANPNKLDIKYPAITIVDTRFNRTQYNGYNYDNLVMTT